MAYRTTEFSLSKEVIDGKIKTKNIHKNKFLGKVGLYSVDKIVFFKNIENKWKEINLPFKTVLKRKM